MSKTDHKFTERTERYFRILLSALLGRDPYQQELDELNRRMEQADDNMRTLNEMYFKVWEMMEETEKKLQESDRRAVNYQTLVEHLRERIKEKNAQIEELQHINKG